MITGGAAAAVAAPRYGGTLTGMAVPLAVHRASVWVQHGQVLVGDAEDGDLAGLDDSWDDAVESGHFVGAADGIVNIVTPRADSSGTPFTVEEWADEPPDDRHDWDHEVDIDIDVPSGKLELFLTTGEIEDGTVRLTRAGLCRLRVSARFPEAGDDAADVYRLRVWPRTEDTPPQLRQSWPHWPSVRS